MRKVIDMRSTRGRRVTAAVALILLAAPAALFAQSPGVTTRASVSSAGAQGDGPSAAPSVSDDGRLVAFSSAAGNLVPGDGNGVFDIFVRDRLAQTTERVSVASDGSEANGTSFEPAISANGRFVAFTSLASNLVPGDGNSVNDVFVHDRDTGETVRVSRAIDGGDPDGPSRVDSISDDGRFVGFWSHATNLVDDDANDDPDSFVFDRDTETIERVSVSMSGGDASAGASFSALSGDGRFVAFVSRSWNLVADIGDGPGVFVRDREAGTTRRATRRPNGLPGNGTYFNPSLSRDGRYVAYSSSSRNLTALIDPERSKQRIYVTDMETGVTELLVPDFPNQDCGDDGVSFPCRLLGSVLPSISADGRFVTFSTASNEVLPANLHRGWQVYVADRLSGLLRRISVGPDHGLGSNCAIESAISGDGRVVAYRTTSKDLVLDDTNAAADVLVSEWACPNTGTLAAPDALPASCDPVPTCPAEPAGDCTPAQRSSLEIQNHPPGSDGPSRARIRWIWRGGPLAAAAFGDPTDATGYALCAYAGARPALQLEARIAPGAGWTSDPKGFSFGDGPVGLRRASLRGGQHSAIRIRGRGPELGLPYLPLDARGPLRVRLHRSDGGCFAADFAPTDVSQNEAAVLRATPPDRPGRLSARVP
jgi:Tol biopolymer transport system component